ncbi:MAG: D-alanyl-D-alanine carboxypeptidase/D-alanyl-D-alanine endopeptidase [Vulcanimicrobiaceae bacterium]
MIAFPTGAAVPWSAAQIAHVDQAIDAAIDRAPLAGSHLGILAIATETGRVVYARDADDAFIPASTLKLVTGSTALERLGPAGRFHTELDARGPIAGGALSGDLILRAGGDPELQASDLTAAAAAVSATGITVVRGNLVVDVSAYDPTRYGMGWSWDDFPFAYSAPISAIAIEENVVHVTVAPAAAAGAPATIAGIAPPGAADRISIVDRVTTGARGSASTADAFWGADGAIGVAGALPLGSASREIDVSVPSPVAYATAILQAALQSAGVVVEPSPPAAESSSVAAVLWSHESKPLAAILADCWLPSDNLIAEMLLRNVGLAASGAPAGAAAGIAVERDFLRSIGVDPSAVELVDGSGLSRENLLTPRSLAAVLDHDWQSPNRAVVLDALPVAGVRGTLAHSDLGTPLVGRLFAKTGSMWHVSNVAGYLATRAHGPVTIVILADDALIDDAALARLRAQILEALLDG